MKRTSTQNKSLHVYFQLLAEELNNSGNDMRKTLKETVDISWSPTTVKEYLWRPIQDAMVMKKSTTELSTKEVNEVYEVLNRFLGEKTGVSVDFPHIERNL